MSRMAISLTSVRCCGCSDKYGPSSACGMQELRVQGRGLAGLRTTNGRQVSSLKWSGSFKLFLSSKVWMMSKSRSTILQSRSRMRMEEGQNLPRDFPVAVPPCLAPPSADRRPRRKTPAPARPPPSARTACRDRKPPFQTALYLLLPLSSHVI